ncbi:MAG: hypothetical protein Q9198_003241, partial [Flavoplaca austrocitrina]
GQNRYLDHPDITIDTLREAICIEDAGYWPTMESIPTRDNIFRWLGCLLRVDRKDRPVLSHFTMNEFLTDDNELVSSSHAARKYMVGPEDERHLVKVCLNYAMHNHSSDTLFSSRQDHTQLIPGRSFYRYVVGWLPRLLSKVGNLDAELDHLVKSFLCMPPCPEFELWEISYARWIYVRDIFGDSANFAEDEINHEINDEDMTHHLPTPLHFACFAGLKGQVEMLLDQGVSPNATDRSKGSEILPIHLSIVSRAFGPGPLMLSRNFLMSLQEGDLNDDLELGDNVVAAPEPYDTQITRMLVQSGADVNHQLLLTLIDVELVDDSHNYVTTPLVLALALGKSTIASLLLDKGANWDARASDAGVDNRAISELCSVRGLLDLRANLVEQENVVRLAARLSDCDGLMRMLEERKLSQDQDRLVTQSTDSPQDDDPDPQNNDLDPEDNNADLQKEFVDAFSSGNWQDVRELLTKHPDLDANCADENGESAVHLASKVEASKNGFTENMKLLLRYGANIEHQGHRGWTPLLLAINARQNDAVELLLNCRADISARLDNRQGAAPSPEQ